jgi:hypothetical protein
MEFNSAFKELRINISRGIGKILTLLIPMVTPRST